AEGIYGSARAQYVRPGWLARDLDLRIGGQWRDSLLPSAMLREFTAGPGVRSTVAPGVFVDFDALYRVGITRGAPAIDDMARAQLALPTDDRSMGPELVASIIAD